MKNNSSPFLNVSPHSPYPFQQDTFMGLVTEIAKYAFVNYDKDHLYLTRFNVNK